MDKDILIQYYARRAKEYEKIYEKPERQEDLAAIAEWLEVELSRKEVLEIACGTGYWTQWISRIAKSVLATDINPEVLEIAKAKKYPQQNVQFALRDIYALSEILESYDALFAGFVWSHIPLQDLDFFVAETSKRVMRGGKILVVDNLYVEGNSSPIIGKDEYGNTYQKRVLLDGSQHTILKNFPSIEFMHSKLDANVQNMKLVHLHYFWLLSYERKG